MADPLSKLDGVFSQPSIVGTLAQFAEEERSLGRVLCVDETTRGFDAETNRLPTPPYPDCVRGQQRCA